MEFKFFQKELELQSRGWIPTFHDISKEIIEIGTETAVGYRNNGYSAAAVRALSEFLCTKGLRVLYKCHHENVASAAVARNAGFDEVGKFFYYVLRKV